MKTLELHYTVIRYLIITKWEMFSMLPQVNVKVNYDNDGVEILRSVFTLNDRQK